MTDNTLRPYRLTRHYTKDGVTKTFDQHLGTLDKVHQSIDFVITHCDHYTFQKHRLIAYHTDGATITLELYNKNKPCWIPIGELFSSSIKDPKYLI